MKAKNVLIALAVILGVLLLLSAYWGYNNNKAREALLAENETLNEEISGLNELKDELELEVDSLEKAYDMLADENETLQGTLEEEKARVARRDRTIRNVRAENAGQINNLRAEISQLLDTKMELEFHINRLAEENDSLRNVTGQLEANLYQARAENANLSNLNQTINTELKRLTLANFKASAFRVEVERKDKVTTRSRKARRIVVTFDLTNVPDQYQGLRPLYMTISDDKGTPIRADNPIMTKVMVSGSPMDIIAVSAKDVDIIQNQRLSFKHDLAERLSPGYYRVSIYTDIGLLGASSFRLR